MNIKQILKKMNIKPASYFLYGNDKAKIKYNIIDKLPAKDSKLILVTAITPTPYGEGKTTVSIGLADALNLLDKNVVLALREPSMGPVFGLKGGAVGGGLSSLIPANDINLHFTGDLHAISAAHNTLSALIDNHIYFGNKLGIGEVVFPRTLDINDRDLRKIETATREDSFIITAASEIMAIMALTTSIKDLKARLGRILIGYTFKNKPVYAADLKCIDALTIILKDAINPNVVQTLEGTPCLVHMGPFANVAHGCNSVLATKLALKIGDYVVTEAGFGSDLGAEKFLDLKCPILKQTPSCVVIVVTIKALKSHAGEASSLINTSNVSSVQKGLDNLTKHIENIIRYNLNYVIALNRFSSDSPSEIDFLIKWAKDNNHNLEVSEGFVKGGEGCVSLASKVLLLCETKKEFNKLYNYDDSIENKINIIAKTIYGASKVKFSKKALSQIELYNKYGYSSLPICIAKTPLSLSGDAHLLNRPSDFELVISELKPSLGAGFIVALTKGIMTMPGLNETPLALSMKISNDGKKVSLK
ncbi:MAG: formate--tetrahydrofolate ligase [Acholeplasmatales bacterium]|jgi:formate--tetrahydrofolate ligase|nr:formate--tetrahydrofolate ligase [Acholeplasmatales bacterium]